MSDVALGKEFIEQAQALLERGERDAAAVLLALAGATFEGPEAKRMLATTCAQFCTMRDALAQIPPGLQSGLRLNADNL